MNFRARGLLRGTGDGRTSYTDPDGNHTAGRSFLSLDNIAIVDRSKLSSSVEAIYQADGTELPLPPSR